MSSQMTAVELLNMGNADRKKPLLNVYWPYIVGCGLGCASALMVNFGTRRPLFSGIQKYAMLMAGWSGVLHVVQNKRDDYFAERDAVLRHYIELHPEDFIECPSPKIGDIIEPWIPIR